MNMRTGANPTSSKRSQQTFNQNIETASSDFIGSPTEKGRMSAVSDNPTQALTPSKPTDKTVLANKGFLCKHTIGSGSYSKVKIAIRIRSSSSTEKYAFKIIDRSKAPKDFQQKFLPRELEIWPQLKHPNIIRMYSYFEHDPKIYMLLEYASNGDVLEHVQKSGALSQRQARTWIKQICDAVSYLHRLGIAHRDLKLENLLIDEKFNIKICDFGFAKMDIVNPSATFCGSKAYAAPEILAGNEYIPTKADVWAVGVILYIFVTGSMPFNEENRNRVILNAQKSLAFPWGKFYGISAECKSLILTMLTYDFSERPDIHCILKDPWFVIEKPIKPKFPPRPKSFGDGFDSEARGSVSVESGVPSSPKMPQYRHAGHFSQRPQLRQRHDASSRHPATHYDGASSQYSNSSAYNGSVPRSKPAEEKRLSGLTYPGSVLRAPRSEVKTPSPLAEPPRPKRIWLNAGSGEQSDKEKHWRSVQPPNAGYVPKAVKDLSYSSKQSHERQYRR